MNELWKETPDALKVVLALCIILSVLIFLSSVLGSKSHCVYYHPAEVTNQRGIDDDPNNVPPLADRPSFVFSE